MTILGPAYKLYNNIAYPKFASRINFMLSLMGELLSIKLGISEAGIKIDKSG